MDLHKALQKIRKANNFSQAYIAEILQTTQQQYSKYETATQEIPVHHIITLSKFYNVSADELLGLTTFMTESEGSYKFNKLYEETINILYWAKDRDHITDEQLDLLIKNIEEKKNEIEEETSDKNEESNNE